MPQSSNRICRICPRRSNNEDRSNKKSSRNFLAAGFSLLVFVILSCSLCDPKWLYIQGGSCDQMYIGVTHFFVNGFNPHYTLVEKLNSGVIENCVTPDILCTLQTCFVLVVFALHVTLLQVFLDLLGSEWSLLKSLQINGVCNIMAVLICVTVNGLIYWAAHLLYQVSFITRAMPGQRVQVQFSFGFYLVVAAGSLSIIATAANCLRYPLILIQHHRNRRRTNDLYRRRLPSSLRRSAVDDDLLILLANQPGVADMLATHSSCRRPLPPTPEMAPPPYSLIDEDVSLIDVGDSNGPENDTERLV